MSPSKWRIPQSVWATFLVVVSTLAVSIFTISPTQATTTCRALGLVV